MEHYLALFEPDPMVGGYVVTFPDFMLIIGDYMREAKPLPAPTRRRGAKFRPVPLPALQSAKVDLYRSFQASGLNAGPARLHRSL